jgi:hypothetical protein|tara:strand:+ start:162 stop:602 length:441 start_codon:yes stop_codon:yes gene_type:complete
MKQIDRLVKLASYYNKIKHIEFWRDYDNKRIIDARAMVYHLSLNILNYTIFEVAETFNKEEDYILELLEHHKSEYNIINYYTEMYQNIETQYTKWKQSDLDLQYCIIKTKYDYDNAKKYEQILNENCMLREQLDKLNYKLKKNYYV